MTSNNTFARDTTSTYGNTLVTGYNCSLFAYGQTGSGKSYSMVGYGKNRGIVPIICDELFKTMKQNNESNMVSKSQW